MTAPRDPPNAAERATAEGTTVVPTHMIWGRPRDAHHFHVFGAKSRSEIDSISLCAMWDRSDLQDAMQSPAEPMCRPCVNALLAAHIEYVVELKDRIAALEAENAKLREENAALRGPREIINLPTSGDGFDHG